MNTTTAQKELIKLHHTLATKMGLTDEERRAMLAGWGVSSSKDMTIEQLQDVCRHMKAKLNEKNDKWRKRVIASIFGYLKMTGRNVDIDYVKRIACRSAGDYTSFNQIPVSRLQTVYYAFLDKQKVLKNTGELISEDLDIMSFKN